METKPYIGNGRSLSDALLFEREVKGIRLSVILRLVFYAGTFAVALIAGQNRAESVSTAMIPVIFSVIGILVLFRIGRARRIMFLGTVLSICDVIAVSLVPVAFYYSTVIPSDISSAYLMKSVFFIIALVFVVINSIMSHPLYPLVSSGGVAVIYTLVFIFTVRDPKTVVTYDFIQTYYGPGVNPYRFGIELVVLLAVGVFLAILSFQFRKSIMAVSSYEQHIYEQEKRSVAGDLSTGMIHEINNQLLSATLLDLIRNKLPGPDRRLVDLVANSHNRIIGIMNEIRAMIRDEAVNYTFETNDIDGVIDEAVKLIRMDPGASHVRFEIDSPGFAVRMDKNKIIQVMINLLKNSVQAIPVETSGLVRISVVLGQPDIEIVIADNGRGIPDHILSRMWEPFYTTKGSRGIGIGLAITRRIVEGHGGTIRCSSAVGEGTKFIIAIPA